MNIQARFDLTNRQLRDQKLLCAHQMERSERSLRKLYASSRPGKLDKRKTSFEKKPRLTPLNQIL